MEGQAARRAAAAEGQAAEGRLRHAPELGQCLPTRKVRGGLTGWARLAVAERLRAAAVVHAAWLLLPPPRLPRGRRAAVRKTGFQGCVAFLAFTSIISKEGQKMQFLELLCTMG